MRGMRLGSQRGSVLFVVIIVATVLAILLVNMLSFLFPVFRTKSHFVLKTSLQGNIESFKQCIFDGIPWSYTVVDAGNPNALRCLLDAGGCTNGATAKNIRLRSSSPQKDGTDFCVTHYDPRDPAMGFRPNGTVCNTFNDSGSDACPYRIEFDWKAVCSGGAAKCLAPVEVVLGVVKFRPGPHSELTELKLGDGEKRAGYEGLQTFAVVRGMEAAQLPIVLMEVKPAGTPGGPCKAGAVVRRQINAVQADPGMAVRSVNGGVFVLRKGLYECSISVPGLNVGSFSAGLFDVSSGAVRLLVRGTSEYSPDMVGMTQTRSQGHGRFELKVDTPLAVDQICADEPVTKNVALGMPFGYLQEVYSVVSCRKYKANLYE